MDLITAPTPFVEALKHLLAKKVAPADLSSADWKDMAAAVRNLSFFSARNDNGHTIDFIKSVVESVINPKQETREESGQTVTTGFNPAKAAEVIMKKFKDAGYHAAPGEAGTITDLASPIRVNLVVKTNSDLALGAGNFVQQNANPVRVQDYPALELYRLESKKMPRDWEQRWIAAARASGDTDALAAFTKSGRMVALKSSGIWQALGDGAGGYDDTLGNPYPPFAFSSGMWTRDVSRAEAIALGLLDDGEEAKPAEFDFASLFNLKEAA